MQSEQIGEIAAALAKAQGACKNAKFDKTNPHFRNRYASLASVVDTIREPFSTNALSYSQVTEMREGGMVLRTILLHSSGQWIASDYPLPMAARPWELGSALTYARRYSLSAIMGISADEDDDAEGARVADQKASTPAPRENPHVTRPEDLSDAKPRYDAAGNRIDWIDTSDIRCERLSKAKAREVAALLNKAMLMNETPSDLIEWGGNHAEQVASLPIDWHDMFQNRYQERLDELRAKEAA